MAKKTYRTFRLKSLDVHVHDAWGHEITAVFRGGIQIDSTAKYSTADPKIQKALEKSAGFGRDFYIESVSEDPAGALAPVEEPKAETKKAEPENPKTDFKDIRRFKNLVEMRAAVKELGIEIADNANYASVKAAAAKEGYDFQIAK